MTPLSTRLKQALALNKDKAEKLYGHSAMSSMAEGTWMPQGALAEHARTAPIVEALIECLSRADEMREELTNFYGGSGGECSYLKALARLETLLKDQT